MYYIKKKNVVSDNALWVAILKQEFAKVIKGRFKQESGGANSVTAISKCTNKIYFVLARSEGIPFSIKASKRLFSVDGCGKSVVWAAFDEDI